MQPSFLKLAKGLSSRPPTQPSLPGAGDLLPEAELGKVLTSPGLCLELPLTTTILIKKTY